MKRNQLSPLVLALFMVFCNTCLVDAVEGVSPATPKFALLIGVGAYPHLSAGQQLNGSLNDVSAMRSLLLERFGFPPKNVITLTDENATGVGIRTAIQTLTECVNELPADLPFAQVVIHFSGHGSQVADQADGPNHDELDGLDETWVPYDATRQAGPHDIRDDELFEFAKAICRNGKTRLLIVADCCHSGTGVRGSTRFRQLDRKVTPTNPSASLREKQLPNNSVFLSACRAREKEPEFNDGEKTYGLLTRFLVETLREENVVSNLTYDLLQKAIVGRYRRDRRVTEPRIPQLEGAPEALRSTVLGVGSHVDRSPYFAVERTASPSRVLMRAGAFHHVTPGSLFELFEHPEQILAEDSTSLAWLRIVQADGTTSIADVIRWDDEAHSTASPFHLPNFNQGYAILRSAHTPDATMRIKVVKASMESGEDTLLGPGDPDLPSLVSECLETHQQPGETKWLHWITRPNEPCDLIVRIDNDFAAVFPAVGTAISDPDQGRHDDVPRSLRGGWGPIDLRIPGNSRQDSLTLLKILRRITRAQNLISLAQTRCLPGNARDSDFDLQLQLIRIRDFDNNQELRTVWQPDNDGVLKMKGCTEKTQSELQYSVRVTNGESLFQEGKPIYVTVLEITQNMGINILIPDPQGDRTNALQPGESRDSFKLSPVVPANSGIAFVPGRNVVIALATRQPSNFDYVAQPELSTTRGHSTSESDALTERLAASTYFRPSTTRGRKRRPRPSNDSKVDWHAQILSWEVYR